MNHSINESENSLPSDSVVVRIKPVLTDLIPGFLQNRRKDVEKLNLALEAGDRESIVLLGHSMKGCGAGYGFEEISTLGQKIEVAGGKGDLRDIADLIERLSRYLEQVEVVFD